MNGEKRSGEFRLPRWKCYCLMLVEQASWVAWTLLLVIVALIAVGFILSPWLGVAAIGYSVFITIMAMSFVIMAYGLNSVTGANMPLHTLTAGNDGIRFEYEDGKTVDIPREDIRPYRIYPGGVLLPVGGKKAGFIWLTPKAFETGGDFAEFLKKIYTDTKYESNTEQKPEILLHDGDGGARL